MFFKKKEKKEYYDKENLVPILMVSICTGETVAGFEDKRNKKFNEVMLIRNDNDLKEFMIKYGLEEIPNKEY
jgi:hypothetical protein